MSSVIAFRVDPKPASAFLAAVFRNQVPFATSLALNQVAKDAQEAERARLQRVFIIRKPWVTQGITIPRFSDKGDRPMSVTIQVDPARAFLTKFEAGGVKYGSPDQPIAIPSQNIRGDIAAVAPLALYPKNLGLVARHGVTGLVNPKGKITKRDVLQLQGKQRTFVLTADMFGVQDPGVYQRTGPGKGDIRLLWSFKQQIPIPARLGFVETIAKTVDARWGIRFQAAFLRAVSTAK